MSKRLIFAFLVSIVLIGCDKSRVFDEYKSLPGHWDHKDTIQFEIAELDSLQAYNLFINLRNNNEYGFQNIYLVTKMSFPHGKVIQDTLEYEMAFPNGKWMGVGQGDVKASKLWYKKEVYFKEEGAYKFQIIHAMRKNGEREGIEQLKGITEVGFRIEKSED